PVVDKVDVDNTNLENADVKKAFVVEATKAEADTDDFEASINGVGLDEVNVLYLLDITSWSSNCL
ncbi:1438_t:CDS:1, partial [Racocetra persica]